MAVTLDILISVWKATPGLHKFSLPASESEIATAESALRIQLPPVFRKLYLFSDGLSLSDGQLTIHPLIENDAIGSLLSMSDQLRGWKWPVPAEVLIFGANGSGEPYGLWTGPHDETRYPEPIIQIGEIFEPGCMGLCSNNLVSLLLDDTLMGLIFEREHKVLFDYFGLGPEQLPNPDLLLKLHQAAANDDEEKRKRDTVDRMNLLDKWSNPETNPQYRDPYAARLDADAMRALLG